MKCPCQRCEDRRLLCHAECEKYLAFREENHRVYDERKKTGDVGSYVFSTVIKVERRLKK